MHLAKMSESVGHLLASAGPADVKADWYYDLTGADSLGRGETSPILTRRMSRLLAIACFGGGAICGLILLERRRRATRRARQVFRRRRVRLAQHGVELSAPQTADSLADQPFAFLREFDGPRLASILQGERASTVALVLAHVEPAKAAVVLSSLSSSHQVEAVKLLARQDRHPSDLVGEIEQGLAARAARIAAEANVPAQSIDRLAEILQHVGIATERTVLTALHSSSPMLADTIRGRMFAFEDIAQVAVRDLRGPLNAIEADVLAVALTTSGRDVRKRIFASLSGAAGRQVKQEMARMGPVRLSDVEAAQLRLVEAIRFSQTGNYLGEATRQNCSEKF